MTDNIVGLRGAIAPAGSAEPFTAAVTAALADGAVWGVLLYVTADGETVGRMPIGCGRVALRGLLSETIDELCGGEAE